MYCAIHGTQLRNGEPCPDCELSRKRRALIVKYEQEGGDFCQLCEAAGLCDFDEDNPRCWRYS